MINKIFTITALVILAPLLLVLGGCAQNTENNAASQPVGKLRVITSFYPLYEIAKNVGGDRVEIKNLVPAGSEPHDYELTPQDILEINRADLVIVNGAGLEPLVDRLRIDLQKKGVSFLEMAIPMQRSGVTADPHFWLDPMLYIDESLLIAMRLSDVDFSHGDKYKENLNSYVKKIQDLHNDFEKGLANCKSRTVITSHEAFNYLAKRYNLEMISVAGFSPEAEVSAKKLTELVKIVKDKKVQYIFTETLVNPKIAETLAAEAGIKTLTLNPLEGLTESETRDGKNYVSVMRENLQNLKTGLSCS